MRIRDFTVDEAKTFVRRFFPIAAEEAVRGAEMTVDPVWAARRTAELTSEKRLVSLERRPVRPKADQLCLLEFCRS